MSEITGLAIDLAKSVFQLHGTDEQGLVRLQRRVSRAQLMPLLAQVPRCTVTMEACGSAHYWARRIQALGHTVRLLAPQYVKAFSRGQKNDRNDAQAIAWAARQPGLPEVAVKSEEQQAILTLHRLRARLVQERVARVNQLHGLASEFGVLLPHTPVRLRKVLRERLQGSALPAVLEAPLQAQLDDLEQLCERVKQLTEQIRQLAQHSPACQTLMRWPGIGPLIATAFLCQVGDPRAFRNGRQVAAWLGLVPRQHSSGERTRLLGITKRGDPYLRKLLVHGARAALRVASRHEDPLSRWALAVQQRRGANRACVALANKLARQLWASLRYPDCVAPA